MSRSKWMHVGDILKMNAYNYPDKLGWQDKTKEFSFSEWNERACRFSNGLKEVGVGYKDTFGVISYNRGEWMDMYAGAGEALAREILEFSRDKIAGYKRPKSIDFIKEDEMPRTPTGKIVHRVLKSFYA